jgi:hypothetical protein
LASKKEDRPIDDINNNKKEIEEGLNFNLSHLEELLIFPRTIMTKKLGYQRIVYSKERVLEHFIESDFIDYRINAYPYLTEYKKIPRYKPDFIFIDIDKYDFEKERNLKFALTNTLKNIREKLGNDDEYLTVLDTGGGYHIYQPVYCPTALENVIEFQKFNKPSEQFLRFAKDILSKGKADKNNNPSFRSCLLRIPRSINSKHNKQVTIVQKWNGVRSSLPKEFMEEFQNHLIQKKLRRLDKGEKCYGN